MDGRYCKRASGFDLLPAAAAVARLLRGPSLGWTMVKSPELPLIQVVQFAYVVYYWVANMHEYNTVLELYFIVYKLIK